MARAFRLGFLLALLLWMAGSGVPAASAPAREFRPAFRERTVIAKPRIAQRPGLERAESAERVRVREAFARLGDMRVITLEAGESVPEAIARLQATGLYEFVEPDYLVYPTTVPNDPKFATQWPLENRQQDGVGVAGADIKAVLAWDIVHDAPNVIVAIIDSGMRLDHPDLAPNLWRNPSPTFGDVNGARIIDGARSGDVTDDTGHGTRMAGLVGAVGNNGLALAGVAWRVQLMPIKVFSATRGTASVSDVAAAIDYAVAHGAHIVNCSLGALGGILPQAELTAVTAARSAGVIVVCSAGNDGKNIDETSFYPANLPLDNVVSVGNSDQSDALAGTSNYGSGVELVAPGNAVPTLDYQSTESVSPSSGTSISTPLVAGALALLKVRFPGDTPRQSINRLLRGAEARPAFAGKTATGGRLNLLRALQTSTNRPVHDDFADRAIVSGVLLALRTNNRDATTEPAEPAHAGLPATGTLWWQWTAPHSATVRITTAGSEFDTILAVYSGGALTTLVPVASNDDAPGQTTSAVMFAAREGTAYQIALAGKSGAAGLGILNIMLAPANDDFASAIALSGESDHANGSTRSATREPAEPLILAPGGTASVWYRWTAPRAGHFEIALTSADFDPLLAVYTGSGLGDLALVAASADVEFDGPHPDSQCAIDAVAGTTYFIQVDTQVASRTGDFALTVIDARWQVSIDTLLGAPPSVGRDGTIYFGQNGGAGYIYALAPDGRFKWKTEVGLLPFNSISVARDGSMFATPRGSVVALRPDGGVRWSHAYENRGEAAGTALGADETVYAQPGDGFLYALAPADGSTRWRVEVGSGGWKSSPVIATDGTLYIIAGFQLLAIAPSGTVKWRRDLFKSSGTPALDAAGNIFCSSNIGTICVSPDNALRWTYALPAGAFLFSSPILSADGTTVYSAAGEVLHAIDAVRGTRLWTCPVGATTALATPALDTDGTIYVAADDGHVSAVQRTGVIKRTWWTGGKIEAGLTIFGGTLFVASDDRKLQAIDLGAFAAGGSWPQEGQNARHTGRAETDALEITVSPQPFSGMPGDSIQLSFQAVGQGPLTYVWRKDGAVIAGATSTTYAIHNASVADSGSYGVTVTGPQGTVSSAPAVVSFTPPPPPPPLPPRLSNLSVRTTAGTADRALIVGYTIGGDGTNGSESLLIRGMGPSLAQFGVADALAAPRLQLYSGATLLSENFAWSGNAQIAALVTQVGAFPFGSVQSLDAALATTRPGGGYTVQVSSSSGTTGLALAEIYDATPAPALLRTTPRLVNLSARSQASSSGDPLIVGFAISGAGRKLLLIRGVGPGLAAFGVADFLREPALTLFTGGSAQPVASAARWEAGANASEIASVSARVGAFALAPGSADAALLTTLEAGSYTVHVSGVGGTSGSVLMEVYEVP